MYTIYYWHRTEYGWRPLYADRDARTVYAWPSKEQARAYLRDNPRDASPSGHPATVEPVTPESGLIPVSI